jgi:hypothetical protein
MKLKTQKAVSAETCGKLWRVDARNGKGNGLKANCKACAGVLGADSLTPSRHEGGCYEDE